MDLLIYGFSAVAIVIGLTQVVKRFVPERFIPLLSIVFGVLLAVAGSWGYFSAGVIVKGIVIGLSASGLWDVSKKSVLNK